MDDDGWRVQAAEQDGMLSLPQLRDAGVSRAVVRHRLESSRWARRSLHVVSTTTGELTRRQQMWLGVLHAGEGALLGGLAAAEVAGLRGWQRDDVTVLVPASRFVTPVPGYRFVRSRRDLTLLRGGLGGALPSSRVEPAVLLFAAEQSSARTAEGVLAALVQQRLTTADRLLTWTQRLAPLRRSRAVRRTLEDVARGVQSVAELDVRRMCRRFDLPMPEHQRERLDRSGRRRFTDCEWTLPDGLVVVLEVDGGFHADVRSYDADMRRQRKLTARDRIIVRCGAAELRDEPGSVAADLRALGVGRSCG